MAQPPESHSAPYAVRSSGSGDRKHTEPDDPLRNPFERDQHRIIESTAFRRLEGKTQVFTPSRHDHFRTRLTHTLEAAQIARCLALDEEKVSRTYLARIRRLEARASGH